MLSRDETASHPRVVIIGAGFGGLSAAKALARSKFAVTLIDRHNYHLFQPLLYQVATAALSPADIASPIRGIIGREPNISVVLADVSGIDLDRRQVIAEDHRVAFDTLIVATGAQHGYFGHDDWARYAPGLKTIDDATYLRRRILLAFEKAETETDPVERRRLLNFVIVGGGPTGVEMAGAVAELAKRALASDFRAIDPRQARIILVEVASRLLTPFDPSLSDAAKISLERLGVEVRVNVGVTAADCAGVSLGEERIEARTIMWAAGVDGVAGGTLARSRDRSGWARARGSGPFGHRPSRYLRDRRHRTRPWSERHALARRGPGRETTGSVCGGVDKGTGRGPDSAAVPLSRLRFARHDRPQACGGAARKPQAQRLCRLAAMERRAHLLSHRVPQSRRRCHQLGVELRYLPAWVPPDYRNVGGSHGGYADAGDTAAGYKL